VKNPIFGGLNQRNGEGGVVQPLYDEGYSHGLSMARKAILKKLYESGTMSSKAILDTFQLSAEEFREIMK
jgi:hypothetical protein